jgi:hypothetical protein
MTLDFNSQDLQLIGKNHPFPYPPDFQWVSQDKSRHVFKSKVITQRFHTKKSDLPPLSKEDPPIDPSPTNRMRIKKIKRNPVLSLKSQRQTQKKKE